MSEYPTTLWRNMNMAFPYEIAKKLGVEPGDKVVFIDNGDYVTVKKEAAICGQTA